MFPLKRIVLEKWRSSRHSRLQSPPSPRLFLEHLESRLAPSATYYVSPSGDDAHDGRSPETAWRSIAKVNAHSFVPGDRVRFEGGATFDGSLRLFWQGGTQTNPITYDSYNTGRATIRSTADRGIWLADVSYVNISDLAFVGIGTDQSNLSGITLWGSGPMSHFYVHNVDVSGYGLAGIEVIPGAVIGGMDDIHITHATLHNNGSGILMGDGADSQRVITNLYIGYIEAYNNERRDGPISGFGMLLLNINRGIIERSLFHDNGLRYGNGNDAVVVSDSDNVIIQYNESFHNADPTGNDGGSFALWNGVTESVTQYNYSHDNSGAGYLLGDGQRNTIRYNISENDHVGSYITGYARNAEIYNNTLYTSSAGVLNVGVVVGSWTGSEVHLRNNIVEVAGDAFLLIVTASSGGGLLFQNNAYDSGAGGFLVDYYDVGFYSLTDWQNVTGQETLDGAPVGWSGDPGLVDPGHGGTIGDPDRLYTLSAYQLQPNSAVRTLGLDLRSVFGIDTGSQDFYGNMLSSGSFSIGTHQPPGPMTGLFSNSSSVPARLSGMDVGSVLFEADTRSLECPLTSVVDSYGLRDGKSKEIGALDVLFADGERQENASDGCLCA